MNFLLKNWNFEVWKWIPTFLKQTLAMDWFIVTDWFIVMCGFIYFEIVLKVFVCVLNITKMPNLQSLNYQGKQP